MNMDLDETENPAKVSDSAYSNSCSNSQSRRSHSSKSTRSGSHSSGSSGYGGKETTSGSTRLSQPPEKRPKDRDGKRKNLLSTVETITESIAAPEPTRTSPSEEPNQKEEASNINHEMIPMPPLDLQCSNYMQTIDERSESRSVSPLIEDTTYSDIVTPENGFSCVISLQEGHVMYTSLSLTDILEFPKDMWIGRSFIDFVHPKDRQCFGTQIMSGVAVSNDVQNDNTCATSSSIVRTMFCRIRKYHRLDNGYPRTFSYETYLPFSLNLNIKDITENNGAKTVSLIVQATPMVSVFKEPNEILTQSTPFCTRYRPSGKFEYIDPEAVPYLGYLPHSMVDQDALELCHVDDMAYLLQLYESLAKDRSLPRSKAYRFMSYNGDYLKLETEFSCLMNPWSRRLEYVCGKHYVVQGPENPDVFQTLPPDKAAKIPEGEKIRSHIMRDKILRATNEISLKSMKLAKQQTSRRCLDLATLMDNTEDNTPDTISKEELRLEILENDNRYERDSSMMLGGISPHHENESKSSIESSLSYTQLNYHENLERYFNSYMPCQPDEMRRNACLEYTPISEQRNMTMSIYEILPDYYNHLSEISLVRHNEDMEKDLMKRCRDKRPLGPKEKKENKQNKKEHLARCNAPYQPTPAEEPPPSERQSKKKKTDVAIVSRKHSSRNNAGNDASQKQEHGLKRTLWHSEHEVTANKHHRPHQLNQPVPNYEHSGYAPAPAAWTMPAQPMFTGMQFPTMNPAVTADSMIPFYYMPTAMPTMTPSTSTTTQVAPQYPQAAVPCMMYPTPMFGPPFAFTPVSPNNQYVQAWMEQAAQPQQPNPATVPPHNFEEDSVDYSNMSMSISQGNSGSMNKSNSKESEEDSSIVQSEWDKTQDSSDDNCKKPKSKKSNKINDGELTSDRTDDESDFSLFFKTESGISTDDSYAFNSLQNKDQDNNKSFFASNYRDQKIPKRRDPPWMEKVNVTPQLIYNYQMPTPNLDEVLESDRKTLMSFEQPSLVNEQLSQLYIDLQQQGNPTRLTLEEGITSSSCSSGEEIIGGTFKRPKPSKVTRKKRQYSRLVMIYEEDAPMPPPE